MGILFIVLPIILIFLIRFLVDWSVIKAELDDIADKPFICPNCGCSFWVKWYRLYFKRITVYTSNCARFKCPSCGEVDMCKHKDD